MLAKLWNLWLHLQTQEVVGVLFFLLAIHDIIQGRWGSVFFEVVVVFSAIQIIRGANNGSRSNNNRPS